MENQSAAPSAPPSPRATRPVSRLRALILALGAVTFGATCRDQNPTGPGLPVHASVAVAPVYQTATSGGPRLRLARIRARLVEVPAGPDTLTQVVDFTGDSAVAEFDVTLGGGGTRLYRVLVDGIFPTGDTLFRGTDTVRAFPGTDVRPVSLQMQYTGPDAGLTAIDVLPGDTALASADSLRLRVAPGEGQTASRIFAGWTSRDATVLTISDSGMIHMRSVERDVWVVAQLWTGVKDSALVHVRAPVFGLTLSQETGSVVRGDTLRLTATARDSIGTVLTGRTIVWSALDTTVLVDSTGLVRGRTARATGRVVATIGTRSDTATITVTPRPTASVSITPRSLSLMIGDSTAISASAVDAQDQPNPDFPPLFASRNGSVVTVSAAGMVRAVGAGTTWLVATSGTATDSVPVSVASGVDLVIRGIVAVDTVDRGVAPTVRVTIANIGTSTSAPFMVLIGLRDSTTGTIVSTTATTIESSLAAGDSGVGAPTVAIPDTANPFHRWEIVVVADCEPGTNRDAAIVACLATPGAGGSIPEANEANNSARRAIAIRAPELSIANASATGAFAAGGSVVVKYDLVNSAGYGGVPVDVVVGLRDVVQNTVVAAASRHYGPPASNTTIPGDTLILTLPANLAVGNGHEIVVWVDCHDAGDPVAALTACLANPTARSDIPEVDEANNRVTFPYPPNAGITSTALSIHLDTLVSLGDSVQLSAQAYQSTTPVAGTFSWASRNAGIATVTAGGRVAAVGNGSTWVVVTEQGGTRDSAQIVVRQRISTVSVTPPTANRYLGKTQQFAASAVDARGNPVTFATFSWSSSAPATVSVDSTGLASMVGLGTAIVRATAGGITGQADVTVLSPIKRIVVAPDSVTLVSFGTSQGYTATAYDTLDVAMTGISFSWASTNPGVANLSGTSGTATSATALANGSTRIRATAQGVTGEALLTVRQVIAGAVVSPNAAIVAPSGRVVFAAYGVDANGYRLTNNPAFSWSTSDANVATVDANGVVTGVAQTLTPTATIRATSGNYFATASVTVQTSGVPPVITFGRDTLKIGRGTSNSIPLYLSVPSGNGVTINLAARDTFAYFTQSSVTIPAGQTTINVTLNGRNAGTTELYATDPNSVTGAGYGGDTAVVAVQANVSFSTTSVNLVATDQRSLSVILSDPAPAGGIYVAFGYGTPGVAEVSPDPVYISPGLLSAPVVVKGLAPGSTAISLSAPGVTGANTLTANVSAASLAWYYGNMMLGAGQMQANANYVYIPQALSYPLTITLSSSDSANARTQPQVVIPAGQTGVYVDTRAFDDSYRGRVTITASVPGWTPATRTLTVTTPHVRLCCNQNLNTTSAPAAIYAYAQDSVGSNHDRINSLRVSLVSRDPSVVTVDTATTIGASANRSNAIYVTPQGGGTTWVVASAGNHTGDSVQVTVAAPNLGIYYGATTLGAGQYEPNANYVYIPNAISTPVTVTFTSTADTIAKAIGPVIIPAGQTGVYFRIEGYKPGSVTYTARATGYNAASQTVRVTSPRLVGCCDQTYPMYQTPVGLTVYARDSLNSGHPVLGALPVTITVPTAADSSVLAVDSSSVVIAAGQSSNNRAHVSFRNPGTGRVIVSAAGWGTDTIVYRVDSAAINIYYGIGLSGAGQMMTNGNYVYVPNARGDTVKIVVRNRNSRIAIFPDTIRIAPTTNGAYFSWEGLAPGVDTIDFSSPGYVGTTRVFPFSRRLLRGSDLPGTLASTAPPFTVSAWTVDTAGNARAVRDTVAVRMVSSDETVLRLDSTIVHIVRGQQNSRNNTARIVGATNGTPVYIIYEDVAGIMPPDTSSALTVIGPALHFYYGGPARVGMRQVARNVNYVYTDNAVSAPLTVTLASSATNVLKSTTATIPAGQSGAYFDITGGDSLGLVRLTATAQGYQLAQLDVDVSRPRLQVSTSASTTTTTPPQSVLIQLLDSLGTEHETTDTFTVTLVSTQPGVAALDSATVRFLPGMSRVNTPKLRYLGTGTTQVIVNDPRTVFYHYTPDTTSVTVSMPVVQAYYAPTSLGTGEYTDNYLYIPNALSDTLRVAVKHNASLTTLPDTIKIPGGQTGVYYRAVGLGVTGTDTITFSAPNHASGTTYLYGGPGRLNLVSWPGTLAVGDSVQVRVQTLDPANGAKPQAAARTFTLSPNSFVRFRDGSGNTITSVTVAKDQSDSPLVWVQAVSSGTGSVTVSGTGYTSAQFNTAVP